MQGHLHKHQKDINKLFYWSEHSVLKEKKANFVKTGNLTTPF